MKELVDNDRIVGGIDERSTTETVNFYKQFVNGEILSTDAKTAEMAKLTENSFRDVNIAFANELSILCDNLDMDVGKLIKLANKHPRVNILNPGPGVGGHCIAVDPWFIIHKDPQNAKLIRTARELNNYKTDWVIEKIKYQVKKFENENNKEPRVACLGLAFKPDIDDLRESPALHIVNELKKFGHSILAVEPNIEEHPELDIMELRDALEIADLVVILVRHKEFQSLKLQNNMLDFS
jgi:UDP-N-acetyl-D-mannosaminuronic acid dehydrogenase